MSIRQLLLIADLHHQTVGACHVSQWWLLLTCAFASVTSPRIQATVTAVAPQAHRIYNTLLDEQVLPPSFAITWFSLCSQAENLCFMAVICFDVSWSECLWWSPPYGSNLPSLLCLALALSKVLKYFQFHDSGECLSQCGCFFLLAPCLFYTRRLSKASTEASLASTSFIFSSPVQNWI